MARFKNPRSDSERVAVMRHLWASSLKTGSGDGDPLLPDDPAATLSQVYMGDLLPAYLPDRLGRLVARAEAAHGTLVARRGAWRAAVAAADSAHRLLRAHVQDTWATLARRNKRLALAPDLVVRYQLPSPHARAFGKARRRWLAHGRRLLDLLAQAEAAGAPPLTEPARDVLVAHVAAADQALSTLNQAKTHYHAAVADMTGVRAEIDRHYHLVAGMVRAALYAYPPATRRELMRAMGFYFTRAAADPPPLPETPEPAAPPPSVPVAAAAND